MIRNKIPFLTEFELKTPMRHILTALDTIHKAGFLHNDITPQNILLDRKEGKKKIYAKLAGFHQVYPIEYLARNRIAYEPANELLQAPEVLQGCPRTEASDIWSFGLTLYLLTCGTMPFKST